MRIAALLALIMGCHPGQPELVDSGVTDSQMLGPRISAKDDTFPTAAVGSRSFRQVEYDNLGDADLTVVAVTIQDSSGWFSFFPTSSCSETIKTCVFETPVVIHPGPFGNWAVQSMYCTPAGTGTVQGSLVFTSDSIDGKNTAVITCSTN